MRKTLIALSLCLSTNAFASPLWEDINSQPENSNKLSRASSVLSNARALHLDEAALRQQLLAPSNATKQARAAEEKLLELPLPDGSMIAVIIEEYPLLNNALAAKFPNIKAWKVRAANGKNIHGRIDITTTGFHAMLTLENGDTIFIDPQKPSSKTTAEASKTVTLYNSFSKQQNKPLFQRNSHKREFFIQNSVLQKRTQNLLEKQSNSSPSLITYRLALSATGEYTQLKGGKDAAFSAMVTTINRVNEIYERDLSIRLSLIANTDKIIYTNPNTDPFTNGDAYAMLDETIANMDTVIGNDNYDIGHLFGGAGTGGLALLSGICRSNQVSHKAGGITGSHSPYGDSFDIDYVAHEMGHQFGATHTFNSETQNCAGGNREPDTAVEPGSGSTIMSYAGMCGVNNLQHNSDAVFNAVSIAQINNYIRKSGEANCGIVSTRSNNNPTMANSKTFNIPSNTAFVLNSNANDIDGDKLTYTWDQIDTNGTAVNVGLDTGDNPLFRSYLPSNTQYRYFPHIDTLFGALPIKGELLALTNRTLNFATTVRDNRGGIERQDTQINTSGNPFSLISHLTSHLYQVNESIDVNWDVAGTNNAPISCSNVDIKLLSKDGNTQNLLLNTPNDGSQNLIIPTDISTISHARMMVACSDNIFFAVSQGNIAVDGISPIATLNAPSIIEGDTENKALNYVVSLTSPSSENISIKYTIRDTHSNAQLQSGLVNIPAGQTTATISQLIAGNQIVDGDKSYTLTLSSPQNIQFDTTNTIDTLSTIGTVIDNDKKIETLADKQDPITTTNEVKKSGGSMGSIFIFLMLYISLLKLRIKAQRNVAV